MSPILDDPTLSPPLDAAQVRRQLELLVQDNDLRPSRRSVAFLRYIVEERLEGRAEELKERTIGVHVFGKTPTYDTNTDHVVRTAASELRKRLSLYYSKADHRDELRILLLPGSYVPQFQHSIPALPSGPGEAETPAVNGPGRTVSGDAATAGLEAASADSKLGAVPNPKVIWTGLLLFVLLLSVSLQRWHAATRTQLTAQQLFWQPILDSRGPVLIAIGDVPHGPPRVAAGSGPPSPTPAGPGAPTVPFADAVAIARISGVLAANGKDFVIRRENVSSFADLRERPTVLVGAFNNEWSLRLTRNLRFSPELDADRHLLYIRDRDNPASRQWQWSTAPHPEENDRSNPTSLHDYSLVSRVLDSETGHNVLVLGGLYTYGTQAAGEFVAQAQAISVVRKALQDSKHKTLQIVLETLVTDGSAGPPRVVAISEE